MTPDIKKTRSVITSVLNINTTSVIAHSAVAVEAEEVEAVVVSISITIAITRTDITIHGRVDQALPNAVDLDVLWMTQWPMR